MNMQIRVRAEQAQDAEGVYAVNAAAFERPDEALLVGRLHAAGAVTMSLVAEADGRIAGHGLFSPMVIVDEAGREHAAVGLGPVAVLPERQRQGIGVALIREGLRRCAAEGHAAVFVLGHPAYYPRFGFRPAVEFGLRCAYEVPEEAFMALELRPGALAGVSGRVFYHPEFDRVT